MFQPLNLYGRFKVICTECNSERIRLEISTEKGLIYFECLDCRHYITLEH